MTIVEFLYGSFFVPIDEKMVLTVLLNRGVDETSDADAIPLRIREILVADIMTSIAKTSYGFRKHSQYGEWNVDINGNKIGGSDMKSFINEAQKIYKKWNVENSIDSPRSAINI